MATRSHTIGKRGDVRLPRSILARLNLRPGARVAIEAEDRSIRIRSLAEADAQAVRAADDRSDLRVAGRRLRDPSRRLIPWEQVKADLDL